MKKVVLLIRPFRLDEVRDVLDEVGIGGIVVTEVKMPGPSHVVGLDFVAKLKLEMVVTDDMAEDVVDAVMRVADGAACEDLLYVLDVEDAVRIRTGERGEEALL